MCGHESKMVPGTTDSHSPWSGLKEDVQSCLVGATKTVCVCIKAEVGRSQGMQRNCCDYMHGLKLGEERSEDLKAERGR